MSPVTEMFQLVGQAFSCVHIMFISYMEHKYFHDLVNGYQLFFRKSTALLAYLVLLYYKK